MWKKSLIAMSSTVYRGDPASCWPDSGSPCTTSLGYSGAGGSDASVCSPATTGADSDEFAVDPADCGKKGKLGDDDDDAGSENGEGVWSPDIEQSFLEAMAVYPPCGRRKIILAEEGKMYGRNELIARYIKLRTGKTRTRKQVSSHIQVLGRRQAKFYMAAAATLKSLQGPIGGERVHDSPYADSGSPYGSPASSAIASGYRARIQPPTTPLRAASVAVGDDTTPSRRCFGVAGAVGGVSSPLAATPQPSLTGYELPSASMSRFADHVPASPLSVGYNNGDRYDVVGTPRSSQYGTTDSGYHPMTPSRIDCQIESPQLWTTPVAAHSERPSMPTSYSSHEASAATDRHQQHQQPATSFCPHPADLSVPPAWQGRSVAGPKLRLVNMAAFVEFMLPTDVFAGNALQSCSHVLVNIDGNVGYDDPLLETIDIRLFYDKFPAGLKDLYDRGPQSAFFLVKFWADMNVILTHAVDAFYATSMQFESCVSMTVQSSTKVCSFGRQVVEKLEKEHGRSEGVGYTYQMLRSPMCDYVISFITKLRQLPQPSMMNSVLENFTVLQVLSDVASNETLLCVAYVFEVTSTDRAGAQHHIYRLAAD